MNYSEQIFQKAIEILNQLSIDENINTIFIAGSVGRKIADEYSDLELFIVWDNNTTQDSRSGILHKLDHKVLVDEIDEDDGEWIKTILVNDLKIDIYHWEERFIDKLYRDVFEDLKLEVYKQLATSSILDGKSIYGDEYLTQIKQKFGSYPGEMAIKSIKEYSFFESWSLRYALLERNDYIALLNLVNETVLQILRLLFALNKVYLRSHNFKWIEYQLNLIDTKPIDLEKRLKFITENINREGVEELDKLVKESLELVQKSIHEIDISKEVEYLNYIRKALN